MRWVRLYGLVGEAARSFDAIIEEKTLPKVGIVGGDISEIQLIRPQTGSPLARRTRRGGRSARPDGFLHGGICKP